MSKQISMFDEIIGGPEGKGETVKNVLSSDRISRKTARGILNNAANHRGRGRTAAEKRDAYKRYREIKKEVIELERHNTKQLILYPASDFNVDNKHFYTLGGRSAIIYAHEIGPRIKRKPVLRRDMDGSDDKYRFSSGICQVEKLDKLEEALAEIRIKREPHDGPLVFFRLHREYLPSEIREMLKLEQKRMDNLNQLIYARVLYPDIHRQVIELKKILPRKVKNMDAVYRSMVGMEMIKSLMVLIQNYSQMAHGDKDELEAAKQMSLECDMLLAEVSLFNELDLWDIQGSVRAVTVLTSLKSLLKGRIINKYEAN